MADTSKIEQILVICARLEERQEAMGEAVRGFRSDMTTLAERVGKVEQMASRNAAIIGVVCTLIGSAIGWVLKA